MLGSHFAQLIAPFFLFLPQPLAMGAGLVVLLTQSWLVLSGNFSWLNLTTIVLTASAFTGPPHAGVAMGWSDALVALVALGLLALSWRPARNLVSRRQLMNASFDPFHLVNTYGAFGSVTRTRYEIVVEGRGADGWRTYEFRGKPTDPLRRPAQWAPYHLRLDWMMWFAALSPGYAWPWFDELIERLQRNDPQTIRLLRYNPFPGEPPRELRATLYRYRFSTFRERRETGAWWVRVPVRAFMN